MTLRAEDVSIVAAIDRSEHIETLYRVTDGRLESYPATETEVPPWDPVGSGEHSVAAHIEFCRMVVARGATFFGAFDESEPAGIAAVNPSFEPGLAWLAVLHVSRPYRRTGTGRALWHAACEVAVAGGARSMYVSATPSESAVGFYLAQGCRLADVPHPELFAMEPDDIHLVGPLR
jgi:GNAT superfamily N-acetyltransferase